VATVLEKKNTKFFFSKYLVGVAGDFASEDKTQTT
jgi:hypothetical protein